MRLIKPIAVVSLVAIASLVAAAALACGPEFEQLLVDRPATLRAPVDVDFNQLARRFGSPLRPAPRPPSPEASKVLDRSQGADELDSGIARAEGLTEGASDAIVMLRSSANGDVAFARGEGLPPVYRFYVAAAVDFRAGMPIDLCAAAPKAAASAPRNDASCVAAQPARKARLLRAAARFDALLELDPEAARSRSAWAAFSLGRLRRELGESDAAVASFRLVRKRVTQGASDPLLLATASLGEEARVELERGDMVRAVALYDQQAASGGADAEVAVQSLRQVAEKVYQAENYKDAVADPAIRRLLVTWLLARGVASDNPEYWSAPVTEVASGPPRAERIDQLLDAIASVGAKQGSLQDADRVAALSYQNGRYGAAARFATLSQSPLALWIQAKLAVRAGDQAQAAARYAEAVEAMSASPGARAAALDSDLLVAETGTLRLAHGEFAQSLELWWSVGDRYWFDLAYVAERVVTTDELKDFVDAHVPAGMPLRVRDDLDVSSSHVENAGDLLRDLLARRLMRDGRTREAPAYFHAPAKRWDAPRVRAKAAAYRQALDAAQAASSPVERARQTFAAATLMRESGLELFGYELAPDGAAMEGNFDFPEQVPPLGQMTTAAEIQRVHDSAATPPGRFHYRGGAALLAEQAADNLPPRSQAYAAVLCHAAHWTVDRQPAMAKAIYERYVHTGAAFAWARHFGGQDCPEPDFGHVR